MTTPRETSITKSAIKKLNDLSNCRAKKAHSGFYGQSEVDIYGCCEGFAFFLEGKRPGGEPTERQKSILRDWDKAGAITGVYTSAAEAVDIVVAGVAERKAALLRP